MASKEQGRPVDHVSQQSSLQQQPHQFASQHVRSQMMQQQMPQQTDIGEEETLVVISAYFKDNSLLRHHLDSFNSFIEEGIQLIINQSPPIKIFSNNSNTHTIRFRNIRLDTPMITEPSGETMHLLPRDARFRNCTYASPMHLEVILEKVGETATCFDLFIGKVPIMLHSEQCALHKKSHADLIKVGECAYDKGGYFIVDGLERVIIAQEKMATNRVFVFQKKQPNKYSFVAQIHSMAENKNRSPNIMYVRMLTESSSKASKACIRCTLPFIRSEIPIVLVFRALGISSDKDIVQLIIHDLSDTEMVELLWDSFEDAKDIKTQEVALEYIGKRGATNPENEERRRYAKDILQKEMLPHVGIEDNCEKKKAYYLGYIIHRLLLCALGRRPDDDKDHYRNKRLDLAGPLFGELFKKLFKNLRNGIRSYAQKCVDKKKEVNLELAIMAQTVTKGFNYALATGNWGLGNAAENRVGVSQVLNRLTYLSTLSHFRRVNSSVKPKGQVVVKPRQLHTSQWGMMCPLETPKGDPCGLVKNLALMAYITVGSTTNSVMKVLHDTGLHPIQDPDIFPFTISHTTKVFVNGDWVGVCNETPGAYVLKLKQWIRKCGKDRYSSIVGDVSLNEVRINTDSGRFSRPLFVVENQRLKIRKQHVRILNQMVRGGWQYLVDNGFVEYIDGEEEETTMISVSIKNLAKERNDLGAYYDTYTHCEIHPSMILGVSASIIPFPNHNQSPRNTYQSAMGKQAIGVYATNYQSRMDAQSFILCYPQRPLVNTSMMEHLDLRYLPAGINAVVAISYHDGYNEGDAIVMNQSSIDRGFFRSLSFRTYKAKETTKTRFGRPYNSLWHLDSEGLPSPGTRVKSNDVMIGMSQGVAHGVMKRRGDTGIVDQVMLTTDNPNGFRSVAVKTRVVRTPQIGDKFSSRHSQKGVIGMTTCQEDMPWTLKGITPDIIINPHSIPDRMTIGQLLECLMGKRMATVAMKKDIVSFTEVTVDNIRTMLHKCGYQRDGLEKMYDGHTGRPIASMIFVGPVYYQRLAHLVEDKIQSCGRTSVDNLTRQPSKQRSKHGAQRFGEMERDSIISHGCALNLKERLFYQSDPHKVYVCQSCGLIGYRKGMASACRFCKKMTTAECEQVNVPYAFKLLIQELMSMGIRISLGT